jgi:uncharacterized protein (DUF1800 family)
MPAASIDDVHHLYRRAGFGLPQDRARSLVGIDRAQLVDGLLNAPAADAYARPNFSAIQNDWERFQAMKHWAFDQMAYSTSPLVEKLALFWHGHFCSEEEKVGWRRMWDQWLLFRTSGRGDFRALTKAVSLQPAMLRYLDNDQNEAGAPQENFARELWELFLLGRDQYTQDEIVDSARAWTGHTLAGWEDFQPYVFNRNAHDNGTKTIFGRTGNHDGPDVIDITLDVKGDIVSKFIAAKLWSFFAWPVTATTGGPVNDVAAALKARWNITEALRALFNHADFWSTAARTGLVKSGIEYQVSVIRGMGLRAADHHPEWAEESIGQRLFNPPNVSGWKSNAYWLSTSAFYARHEATQSAVWQSIDRRRRQTGADDGEVFGDTKAMTPAAAASAILERIGVVAPTAETVSICTDYLVASRANWGWGESGVVCRLAMLAPEFHTA